MNVYTAAIILAAPIAVALVGAIILERRDTARAARVKARQLTLVRSPEDYPTPESGAPRGGRIDRKETPVITSPAAAATAQQLRLRSPGPQPNVVPIDRNRRLPETPSETKNP